MNYAFKMMAVVLALGVLVLQGCQTTIESSKKLVDYYDSWSNDKMCDYYNQGYSSTTYYNYIKN